MRKNLIDNGDYRLWAKDDVEKIYTDALAKAKEEDEAHDRLYKEYNDGMTAYFKECNSIADTADQYNLTKDEILDALGDDTLKDATDYSDVKINSSTKKTGGIKTQKRGQKSKKGI